MSDGVAQNTEHGAGRAGEPELGFEQALGQLERLAVELEDGQLGLSDALARYERGVGLLRRCQDLLTQAERRIELLVALDTEGRATTEPLADTAGETLHEKADNRVQRRGGVKRAKVPTPKRELFDQGF